MTHLAREYTEWAIDNLREIAGDTDQSRHARVAATNALLDRGHGKPPQLTTLAGAVELADPGPREVRIMLVEPPAREPEGGTG